MQSLLGRGRRAGACLDATRTPPRRCARRSRTAVRSQMMADVPLGAFLSGGIDSSAIVALMSARRRLAGQQLQHGLRRRHLQRAAVSRARWRRSSGPTIASGRCRPTSATLFERLVVHLDEPFADVSLFPTFIVSELAREHVKVALSGDGGDELFGGYDAYQAQALAADSVGGRCADAGARAASPARAAADGKEEGPRQQGQALHRRRRARRRRDLGHYRWMVYLGAARQGRLYTPALRRRARSRPTSIAPVRDALGAVRPGRRARTGSCMPTCPSISPTTSS